MSVITNNFDLFFQGFLKTLGICIICLFGSLALGTVIAGFRVSPVAPLRGVGTLYVNVVRNCPLTVVLFLIAFGLPEIGINQSYYVFGCASLIIYTAAFVCEALRSGINAIPAGQAEAARAIGLTFSQNLGSVILPQAFRTAIPPVGSVIIAMFKNSAILGAFGVSGDLLSNAIMLTSSRGQDPTPVYLSIGFFFLLITIPAGLLLMYLERKAVILR
ncbi:amino acid ABC transporter permease [Kineosporia succinea]|uniref:Glutamate transport system permease protein n=1 Tax=Kineosporia succinea TaxID=84632 RepID=A0ABT9NWI0_9ACTN|nr:amino acid ABC transporter permease [Kineosporia succinea]MDP9824627.1 glutamate transport system permease protein [Kineosporia succinea]